MPPATIAPPKASKGALGVSGDYTKLSLVGKGAFGAVYLVRHTQKGGETLIMKEVQTKGLAASEIRATKQETAVLKHVSHPNIIGYHTTFEADGLISIVMEYAAGGDLGRLIAKRMKEPARFSESDIKRYATQLGSALEYLHNDIKLLHRDVKPKNVFLSGAGDVRLGDFGLSKVLSKSDGVAEVQVGTPLYMSPELAAGKPYDRGADVWAFGCTLYECMSFKPPWSELCTPEGGLDGGMKALANALRNRALDIMSLRSHYSEEWCAKLTKLLAKKREERMPLASLIAELTEAPKHPASWGLSAAAQAALDAANAPEPPPQAPSARKSKKGQDLLDHGVDEDDGATGIEVHAAAIILQRSVRKGAKQVNLRAPGEESLRLDAMAVGPGGGGAPSQPSKRGTGGLSERLKIPTPALRPGSAPGAVGGPPKKTALKPSRVETLKPALKATSSSQRLVGPSPSGRAPSVNSRAPSLRAPSQRAVTPPKPPPAKKPGLKPTRVRDGLG